MIELKALTKIYTNCSTNTPALKEMDKIRQSNISFIFQNFALMKERTLYDNIELPLIARNVKPKLRKKK